MKKLRITFPYRPEAVSTGTVQALFNTAQIAVDVGAVEVANNVVTIEVSRELTAPEIATARGAFQAAYPRIENVA